MKKPYPACTDQEILAALDDFAMRGKRATAKELRKAGFHANNQRLSRLKHEYLKSRQIYAPTLSIESAEFLGRESSRCQRVATRLQLLLMKVAAVNAEHKRLRLLKLA